MVRFAVAEQAMHHRASQRAIGPRAHQHRQIGLLHGSVHVNVDGDDLGAAVAPRSDRMGHNVDLGVDRIGPPDDDQIGLRHFARVRPGDAPRSGGEAGIGRVDADGRMEAGIFLGVAQPMNTVAHDQAHGAGIVVGPHGLGAVPPLGFEKFLRDMVERCVPGRGEEFSRPLGAAPDQRLRQTIGVMFALRIARHLGADDAGRVVVIPRPVDASDGVIVEDFDIERAGRRTVVRTGGCGNPRYRPNKANRFVHCAWTFTPAERDKSVLTARASRPGR